MRATLSILHHLRRHMQRAATQRRCFWKVTRAPVPCAECREQEQCKVLARACAFASRCACPFRDRQLLRDSNLQYYLPLTTFRLTVALFRPLTGSPRDRSQGQGTGTAWIHSASSVMHSVVGYIMPRMYPLLRLNLSTIASQTFKAGCRPLSILCDPSPRSPWALPSWRYCF